MSDGGASGGGDATWDADDSDSHGDCLRHRLPKVRSLAGWDHSLCEGSGLSPAEMSEITNGVTGSLSRRKGSGVGAKVFPYS